MLEIKDFKDLIIWQKGMDLAEKFYIESVAIGIIYFLTQRVAEFLEQEVD